MTNPHDLYTPSYGSGGTPYDGAVDDDGYGDSPYNSSYHILTESGNRLTAENGKHIISEESRDSGWGTGGTPYG